MMRSARKSKNAPWGSFVHVLAVVSIVALLLIVNYANNDAHHGTFGASVDKQNAASGTGMEGKGIPAPPDPRHPRVLFNPGGKELTCFKCTHAASRPEQKHQCKLMPFSDIEGAHFPQQHPWKECHSNPTKHPWQDWVFSGKTVWEVDVHDYTVPDVPPKEIPAKMLPAYTMNSTVELREWYFIETQVDTTKEWTPQTLSKQKKARVERGYYGSYKDSKNLFDVLEMYRAKVESLRGAVIGSLSPWVEEFVLEVGAAHITTIEYGTIVSTIPEIDTITPPELEKMAADGVPLPQYDFIVSFSSLEHAGLGRYGDPLNPVGDLQAIARASCLLKPGGVFFLSFDIRGRDQLFWNAHRVYGPHRLKFVTENFRLVAAEFENSVRPILVMQNMRGCSNARWQ